MQMLKNGHEATPEACLDELLDMIRARTIFAEFKANPTHIIGCITLVIGGIVHNISQKESPLMLGSSDQQAFNVKLNSLATELATLNNGDFQYATPFVAGGLFDILGPLVAKKLLDLLKKLIEDQLNTTPIAVNENPT